MHPVATYVARSVVCVSVYCVLVTQVGRGLTQMGPRYHVLMEG